MIGKGLWPSNVWSSTIRLARRLNQDDPAEHNIHFPTRFISVGAILIAEWINPYARAHQSQITNHQSRFL
jgi:hypothetical protein